MCLLLLVKYCVKLSRGLGSYLPHHTYFQKCFQLNYYLHPSDISNTNIFKTEKCVLPVNSTDLTMEVEVNSSPKCTQGKACMSEAYAGIIPTFGSWFYIAFGAKYEQASLQMKTACSSMSASGIQL